MSDVIEMVQMVGVLGGFLMALYGLLSCMFGYKLFRFQIGLIGFIFGGIIGAALGAVAMEEVGAVVIGILFAALGAWIAYKLYLIGVFISIAVPVSAGLTLLLGVTGSGFSTMTVAISCLIGLILGVIGVIIDKPLIICSTAFSGGMLTAWGLGAMLSLRNLDVVMIIGLLLAVMGAILQFRWEKKAPSPSATAVPATAEDGAAAPSFDSAAAAAAAAQAKAVATATASVAASTAKTAANATAKALKDVDYGNIWKNLLAGKISWKTISVLFVVNLVLAFLLKSSGMVTSFLLIAPVVALAIWTGPVTGALYGLAYALVSEFTFGTFSYMQKISKFYGYYIPTSFNVRMYLGLVFAMLGIVALALKAGVLSNIKRRNLLQMGVISAVAYAPIVLFDVILAFCADNVGTAMVGVLEGAIIGIVMTAIVVVLATYLRDRQNGMNALDTTMAMGDLFTKETLTAAKSGLAVSAAETLVGIKANLKDMANLAKSKATPVAKTEASPAVVEPKEAPVEDKEETNV